MKNDKMMCLPDSTACGELLQLPEIGKYDAGDVALEKMWPIIPQEMKPYILKEKDIPGLFVPRELFSKKCVPAADEKRAIVLCRVSTCGTLQDVLSPLKQANSAINLQKRFPSFKVAGCILDFFKNGRAVRGRMFWDMLYQRLETFEEESQVPVFNCIYFPEFSRMSRRASKIWELAEYCRCFGIQLIDKEIYTDYASPQSIHTLSSKAAEAEAETYKFGQRLSESDEWTFEKFRTMKGKHFGFKVKNIKGFNNRVAFSAWERVETEIAVILFAYDTFPVFSSFSKISVMIKNKFGCDMSPQMVERILTTKKYLGIVYRPKRFTVVNPITDEPVNKEQAIPPEVLNDMSERDFPPFKYFVEQLKIITLEQWQRVQEIIRRKRSNIARIPCNPKRGHRPARESGRSPYSGLLICGKCGGQLVLYGPSGTRLFACQNKRKKICRQHQSVREDTLNTVMLSGIRELLDEKMPEFIREYRYEFSKRVDSIIAEKNGLDNDLEKQKDAIKSLVLNAGSLSTPTKIRFDQIIAEEMEKKERLEKLINARSEQIAFLSKQVDFNLQAAQKWLGNIEELFRQEPQAANEALRKILEKIEIDEMTEGEGKTVLGLRGRLVFKPEGLARFFNTDVVLRNFYYPHASTKQLQTIVFDCSVEAEIRVNFEVFASRRFGAINREGDSGDVLWRFVPIAERSILQDAGSAGLGAIQPATTTTASCCDVQMALPDTAPVTGTVMTTAAVEPEEKLVETSLTGTESKENGAYLQMNPLFLDPDPSDDHKDQQRGNRRKKIRVVNGPAITVNRPRLVMMDMFNDETDY